jgi:DNA-binding LacI/PurR family transcriptional regulator
MAERMGYQKNAMVSLLTAQLRSSRLKKTESTIAYITSMPHSKMLDVNPTYHQFFTGAKVRAEQLGYGMDVLWRRESAMSAARFTQILISRGIRGVLLAPRPKAMSHISLDWSKFACASIGHPLPAPRLSFSGAWHDSIMHTTLRMVKKRGYRRVGFCIDPASDRFTNFAFSSRYCFYQHSLPASNRIPFFQEPLVQALPDFRKFERWFVRHRPDVLLCVGPGIPDWLRKLGCSVPEDVSIADLCLPDDSGNAAGMFEMPGVIAATAVDLVVERERDSFERSLESYPLLSKPGVAVGAAPLSG